jgi:hypothetical protein
VAFEDGDKMGVEQFGLADNLMVIGAIHDSGVSIVLGRTRRRDRYTDLTAFEDCVKQATVLLVK